MHYLKPDPTKVNVQLPWISLFSKSSWIKASGLSYKLGVNGEKKLMETGILIKMDIAHFTLVNLGILTV